MSHREVIFVNEWSPLRFTFKFYILLIICEMIYLTRTKYVVVCDKDEQAFKYNFSFCAKYQYLNGQRESVVTLLNCARRATNACGDKSKK